MAEQLIHIKNVIGSGQNGKVLLSDLDLSEQDLAKFTNILSGYLKSGAFSADLSSPDFFGYGPRNYNMIPYFDSFELYLDKVIPGLATGNIEIRGSNLFKYNGGVSAQITNEGTSTYILHPDTSDPAYAGEAWMMASESSVSGTSKYYFSGFFKFSEILSNNVTLEIINKTNELNVGTITITPAISINGVNDWVRVVSPGFQLNESDLLTFKLSVSDTTTFYMDALQLEKINDSAWTGSPRAFIQSGAVITEGMNIRIGSITGNAIKALTIGVDKVTSNFGNEIDISSNIVINADRKLTNLIDYKMVNFETGSLDPLDGSEIAGQNNDTLRTKGVLGFSVTSLTDYVITLTPDLAIGTGNSAIFWYNNQTFLGYDYFNSREELLTSRAGSNNAKIRLLTNPGNEFFLEEINQHYVRLETNVAYLSGAKYRFDGDAATFTNGGLIINNAFNEAAFTADTYGITLYNTSGTPTLWANSNGDLTLTGTLQGVDGTFSGTLQGADIQGGTIKIGTLLPEDSNSVFKANNTDGIWAGNTSSSAAPFKVNLSGALTATNATISGSVTATSGAIGGWRINNGKLTSGSGSGKVILDGPNNRLYLNTAAYLEPYSDSSIITLSGGLLASGGISASNLEVNAVIAGQMNSTIIFPTGITHSVYGEPARLELNTYPIVTENDKASENKYGVAKIWLDGTTLKIET